VHAVGHTHPRYTGVLATTGADLVGVTREGSFFHGRVSRYGVTANLIATPQLGAGLAAALDKEFVVLMRNHGVVFCGRGIGECAVIGVLFERACEAQLVANASGLDWSPSRPGDQERRGIGPVSDRDAARFWNYYRRRLARAQRQTARHGAVGVQRHASAV
jgi:L-fuculose-phosphate aldolase